MRKIQKHERTNAENPQILFWVHFFSSTSGKHHFYNSSEKRCISANADRRWKIHVLSATGAFNGRNYRCRFPIDFSHEGPSGISNHYQFNENQLNLAEEKIEKLKELSKELGTSNMHELMFVYELKNRLTVCETLIYHLRARKETRWHSFAENLDYPDKSDEWLKYVNTRKENGKIQVLFRELVKRGETYEHSY